MELFASTGHEVIDHLLTPVAFEAVRLTMKNRLAFLPRKSISLIGGPQLAQRILGRLLLDGANPPEARSTEAGLFMPIRILHIIGQLGIGGCETHLLELCRRMDRSRYCPAVCYYSQTPASLESGFREAGVRLYFTDKFGGQGICTFFQKLRGFVLDFKPDIIHTWQ